GRRADRRQRPVIVGNVRKAYARGIPFAAGSDCGGQSHPHGRYARNVRLVVRECGLSVEHAIRAVTGYAAQAEWFDNVGTLEGGRLADVAVRGDLTQHVEAIENKVCIELVMQAGRVVKPVRGSADPAISKETQAHTGASADQR